jgi:hypothetical protein
MGKKAPSQEVNPLYLPLMLLSKRSAVTPLRTIPPAPVMTCSRWA